MSIAFDAPLAAVPVSEELGTRPRTGKGSKAQLGSDPLTMLRTLWSWLQRVQIRRAKKRMRLCESVPLGDKRFIAVVQVDDREFLIAGASNSVSMLTDLGKRSDFSSLLIDRKSGVTS
jgi:hypothetical protein